MTLRELYCRLTGLLRPQNPDPDLEDEIASHLELAKTDYLRRGMSEAEAQRLAGMEFGSVAAAKEHVWEQRQVPGIAALLQDAQYAARGMRKSPGFTLVTVATFALGIGLCSVIYTLLNGIFLRPLPGVPEPDRLAILQGPVPYPWFESYREQGKTSWTAAAFIGPVPFGVAMEGTAPERITGALVSPEYFAALRVQPLLGRWFDPRFEPVGGAPAVVLTERFWRTHLRADPHVIGHTLRVNGCAVPIIGVGPRDFFGTGTGSFSVPEIFIPATASATIAPELQDDVLHRSTQPAFRVLLRLAPGTTIAAAEARFDVETRELDKHREQKGRLVRLLPAGTVLPVPKELRIVAVTYYGVLVAAILGLTCANLGGLLLARGAARGREFAIRLSIGANRFRLVRQLLTESAILAAAGGAAGFAAANGIFGLLRRIQTGSNALTDGLTSGPDLKVALFTFAISVLAAASFGLTPALALTRLDLTNVMKANLPAGLRHHRHLGLRNLFVICQVAAAMVLMLVMGFFLVGIQRGLKTEPAFDPGPVSFFSVDPPRDGLSPSESLALLRHLPERLARVPGVEGVSLASRPPLSIAFPDTKVSVSSLNTQLVAMESVGPKFFSTVGAAVLRGAEFGDRDLPSDDGSVKILPAVINQAAASELFGDRDPLGRRIRQNQRTFEITGVVRYVSRALVMGKPVPTVFVPLTANDWRGEEEGTIVVIRARTQTGVAALRRELSAIDARLTLFHPQTLREYIAELDRAGSVFTIFYVPIGLFGLILACLGIAGVTAQSVERRRKEIGIRMALGARRAQLLRLIMGEGAAMVITGAVLGFAGASALARILSAISAQTAQIIGPVTSNPLLTLGIPSFLIALAAIACYVPARRSASVDPLPALREE